MQFLQIVTWMCRSLPRLATVTPPPRRRLETLLAGTKRTKRVARNRTIQEEARKKERRVVWDAAYETLENAVALACPKSG